MPLRRLCVLFLLLLLGVPGPAGAQGVPSPASEHRAVEVDVQATDGGTAVSAEDAARLGLTPDGTEAKLVPPSLVTESPAAWPEGLEGTPGEVTLELLVDVEGAVADVKVVRAPAEPRLTDAAVKAAPGLRFTPATLGGTSRWKSRPAPTAWRCARPATSPPRSRRRWWRASPSRWSTGSSPAA